MILFYFILFYFILFYFILVRFQGHFILFLIWIYDPERPFQLGRSFAAILLVDHIDEGRRG